MDPNHNTNIPEEILFEILVILPVKSLRRFMCVSKHWFSIISDPNFVSAHFLRSSSKSRAKLLFSVTTGCSVFPKSDDQLSFYSIDYPEEDEPSSSLHVTRLGSLNCMSGQVISTSTSGLICCICYQGIRIGNPITGEFKLIHHHPDPMSMTLLSPIPMSMTLLSDIKKRMRAYLGFDPIDNRQVLLKLDNYLCKNSLFSLLESQWHDIPPHQTFASQWHDIPPHHTFARAAKSAICMNGVIHFTTWVENLPQGVFDLYLYAFDVRLESFEMIQLPHGLKIIRGVKYFLIEYKDRVALIYSEDEYEDETNEVKLWILEDPKNHSWSFKSFLLPWSKTEWEHMFRTEWKRMFYGATHRGELMFATGFWEDSLDLFLFDIDTNTLRRFQVDGLGPGLFSIIGLDFLMESLHSPK